MTNTFKVPHLIYPRKVELSARSASGCANTTRRSILMALLLASSWSIAAAQQWRGFPGATVDVGESPLGLTAADFNGDGLLDLAVVSRDSNDVSVLLADTVEDASGKTIYEAQVRYAVG